MLRSSASGNESSPRINREVDCKGFVIKDSILTNFPIVKILGHSTLHPSPSQEEGEGHLKFELLRVERQSCGGRDLILSGLLPVKS